MFDSDWLYMWKEANLADDGALFEYPIWLVILVIIRRAFMLSAYTVIKTHLLCIEKHWIFDFGYI